MLEMLLVFAIFAVLAGIIVFSLQPADVLQDANNIKVLQTTKDIESAIQAYSIAHRGNLTALLGGISEEGYYDICKQDVTDDSCVNLTLLVSEGNLSNIPIDSANAGTYSTGYKLYYKPETKKYDVLTNSEYTSAVASEDPLANGLIGYWKMDEGSWNGTSGEVIDASGNAKNAVAVNGAYISGGKFGNGGTFDGTNDYVNAGDLGTLPAKGTLSFWMKPTAVQNYRNPIATKYNGGNAGFRFEEYTTASPYGGFNVIMGNDAGTYTSHSYLTSTILTVNNWYHVILTWDTLANTVVGYLDGVQKFSEAQTYWPTTIPAMAIGSGFDLTRYWKGNLDEVRIYDRILTSEEATTLYSWGPGPIRHWKFDETGGVIAQDSADFTPIVATGGTVTEVGDYRIHTFTSSGTFTVTSAQSNSTVEALVVAGGGGGGSRHGGGGGAGGILNSLLSLNTQSYAVTVGNGGSGGNYGTNSPSGAGFAGGNSVFSTLTAIGGGGGCTYDGCPAAGGSGGGGAGVMSRTGAAGTAGQGFAGGTGSVSTGSGGGGGGASIVGENSVSNNGGNGGSGIANSISGTSVFYGGGGGGGSDGGYSGGTGGNGGGGHGGNGGDSVGMTAGSANTGGGGGGNRSGSYGPGAAGGSGIVIVRYPLINSNIATITNGTNLALNKPATLSTTLGGFIASNCNNGNLTDFCHSNAASGDWWKVDLQANYNVNKVVVYNRTDCCQSRAANFKIEISTTGNFTGEQTLLYQAGVSEYPGYPSTYNVTTTNGRYVRFFVPAGADKVLNIAEIQVFGESNTTFVAGKYGNAVSLDGVDDYIELGGASSLSFSNAVTVEAWFKKTSGSGYKGLVDKGRDGYNGWSLNVDETAGKVTFKAKIAGVNRSVVSAASYNSDAWNHAAGVFDGTNLKVYLNGVATSASYVGTLGTNAITVRAGAANDGFFLNGLVDDIRIYNYARTQSQILNDMNNL